MIAALTIAAVLAVATPAAADPLTAEIGALDAQVFDAYNRCDLPTFSGYFDPKVAFYHDTGGATFERDAMVEGVRKYICGKVRRELIPATFRVYPIKDYGAIEEGEHRFCELATGRCEGIAKFVMVWTKQDGAWRITNVLSYGHRAATPQEQAAAAPQVEVRTGDVERFYRIYDAAHGAPTGEALQRDYIDGGSDGVRQFVPYRIKSGADLAAEIAKHRDLYDRARECMSVLPAVETKLAGAFQRLAELDPDATFPPVTILIGRNNSGGSTGRSGVLIGLEVVCRSSWLQPDLSERLYHLIAHEYGHVEQFPDGGEDETPGTVLNQSLVEGGAELVAELISGQVSNIHLQSWTQGREREIDTQFLAEQDSLDLSHWLYTGPGTPEKPGDLGYWVGYRIARAYYLKAPDKRLALKSLLEMKDPKAILADSGWTPGAVY